MYICIHPNTKKRVLVYVQPVAYTKKHQENANISYYYRLSSTILSNYMKTSPSYNSIHCLRNPKLDFLDKVYWNLTTMQEISSLLFLDCASATNCFAAEWASFMFLIESTASWLVIAWQENDKMEESREFHTYIKVRRKTHTKIWYFTTNYYTKWRIQPSIWVSSIGKDSGFVFKGSSIQIPSRLLEVCPAINFRASD